MSWYRQIERYCYDDITLVRGPSGPDGVGTDAYGEPIALATPEELSLKARVEWHRTLIHDDQGREVTAVALVFVPRKYTDPGTGTLADLEIGPEDRIVFEGRSHAIARRNLVRGWEGDPGDHWEIYLR